MKTAWWRKQKQNRFTAESANKQGKRSNQGFTLLEMLVTTLIMGMVSVMIATSIPTAFETYTVSTRESEAQVLCDTLATAIRDELRYATDICENDDGIVFTSRSRGYGSECMLNRADGKIVISKGENSYPLLPDKAYNNQLLAELRSCEISEESDEIIQVMLAVTDRKGNELACQSVRVKPLNGIE